MIKIGRPEKDYYTCQSCNSNYSVNKITIGLHESSTSSFRICDHCLMKMGDIKVLEVMELNKKLQEQNKIMRKALEFYADPEKWILRREDIWSKVDPKWHGDSELIKKYKHPKTDWIGSVEVGGKRAREALAKVGE